MTGKSPYIHIMTNEANGVLAFFALNLETIGTCNSSDATSKEYVTKLLNRQVDFIATLPATGQENSIEIRFSSQPVPDMPQRGQVRALLRVGINAQCKEDAYEQAMNLYKGLRPNLLSISDNYGWVPVRTQEDYLQWFEVPKSSFVGELARREAWVHLDKIEPSPPHHSIGFIKNTNENSDSGLQSAVYYCFPFVRNFNSMDRLFNTLLLQEKPAIISITLSPTQLTNQELNFLMEQTAQCERYIQLPNHGSVANPAQFTPPLRTQARFLLNGLQWMLFTLRDDCFSMKIRVAASTPVETGLFDALGVSITEHVASTDTFSDANVQKGFFQGGYDLIVPTDDDECKQMLVELDNLYLKNNVSTCANEKLDRLRYLFDANQANCAFRFPVPRIAKFPGLSTQLARTVSPPANLPEDGLFIGNNSYCGINQPVYLLRDDRRRHAYIYGKTGTGKSMLLLNMILQDINNGEGVAVIDPHGELVDQILERLPPERIDDVIYINPEIQESIIGLNLLEYRDELDRDSAINHLIEIFDQLYDMRQAGGPVFEMYLRNSALLVMSDPEENATLDSILRVFVDDEYRLSKLKQCKDKLVSTFWVEIATKLANSDWSLPDMGAYINSKLSRMTYNPLIRRIVLQQKSSIDFLDVMDDSKIVLVDLCKGKLGQTNSSFLALVLTGLFQRAAFARTKKSTNKDIKDFYLYVDEFQNLATESFITILSEARKYGLNTILTNQYLHQIPEKIRDAVIGNVGTIIGFRAGMRDANLLEPVFGPTLNKSDLTNLPNYHAYVSTLFHGEITSPFNICTQPEQSVVDEKALEKVKVGMKAYGRSKKEIDASIASRFST